MYFIFHLLSGAGGESINEMPMQGSQAKRVNLGEIDARQVTLMHVFRRYYMYFKKKKLGEDLVSMKQTTTMRMCLSNTSPCKYVDVYATIAHDWE